MSYEKLVRDKIPQIIENNGQKPITRILGEDEYRNEPGDPNERADIEEVLRAIDKAFGFETQVIEAIRRAKVEERGGFTDKIYLEGIKE